MPTTQPEPEAAAPTQVDAASPNPSSPASRITHPDEDKGAAEPVTEQSDVLKRSISNPVVAIDPATQLPHVGSDPPEVTDEEKGAVASEKEDPNIVDFDGPDDPEKAVNWSRKAKFSALGLISVMTFITYACNILPRGLCSS
jgi:hypothetical protein